MAYAMAKQNSKRPAPPFAGPSKKRKLAANQPTSQTSVKSKANHRGKTKKQPTNRDTIPIPLIDKDEDEDIDLSEQDLEILGSASFLDTLDYKGIARSKMETERLHRLNQPKNRVFAHDDLPSVDSHDEDKDSWNSDMEKDSFGTSDAEDVFSDQDSQSFLYHPDTDDEMPYEMTPRIRHHSWDSEDKPAIKKLPIKLADGRIRQTGVHFSTLTDEYSDEEEEQQSEADGPPETTLVEDVSTGARFGRAAVVDIVGTQSKKERIQSAKEQIAGICQEIISDPENNLGLLKRLYSFSMKEIQTPTHPDPVIIDPHIRRLAIISQLAVFKDIIPGYKIRPLTDKEKAEKVSQMVARTRDWEQGLVGIYQTYLRLLEAEIKDHTDLAVVALQCMCTLLSEVPHFNFRVNLMTCIVARLSQRSWNQTSDLCLKTLIKAFDEDLTGTVSLDIVRLLNRMIKERRFNVHPQVLSCLLHLRLKTELGVRASHSKSDRNTSAKMMSSGRAASKRAKGKTTDEPHLTKKMKKTLKEKKEIAKEFRETEAEIDKEERAVTHTETLKLLFALYFRILKNSRPTPLLPAVLNGISKFAHLVNIDFFEDLMQVLKDLISQAHHTSHPTDELSNDIKAIRHRLSCIVTAFELLSGQGEALNIDLTDFISSLHAIILPLSLMDDIAEIQSGHVHSVADMLFRALDIVFSPRTAGNVGPSWRSAAFAKRLLNASLHWPPATALRAIDFVRRLIAKDLKLEALLHTEDRVFDGIYRPDVDDPQLSHPFGTSFWELHALHKAHWHAKVREEAGKLLFSRT